jgi:hypothetical protein
MVYIAAMLAGVRASREDRLAYTTALTILRMLEGKGALCG